MRDLPDYYSGGVLFDLFLSLLAICWSVFIGNNPRDFHFPGRPTEKTELSSLCDQKDSMEKDFSESRAGDYGIYGERERGESNAHSFLFSRCDTSKVLSLGLI